MESRSIRRFLRLPRVSAFVVAAALLVGPAPFSIVRGAESALTDDDKQFLDGLFKAFLFDPTGARRVKASISFRTVWGGREPHVVECWVTEDEAGRHLRFIDGYSYPANLATDIEPVDFVAACQARLRPQPKSDNDAQIRPGDFAFMQSTSVGIVVEPKLVLAAWLYKLGHEALAAEALEQAREEQDNGAEDAGLADLRKDLAWSAFAGLVHAFMVRADEVAESHGERLLRLYPQESADEFDQAKAILADLKRRKEQGNFGQEPAEGWPEGFATWDAKKKTEYLIAALDEVDARQWGQPGGVMLAEDRRVAALIEVGEPAVPALIDAIAGDNRLTRSVHFWRDFATQRTVLEVREAALTAVQSILRVQVFEPVSTGDNFTSRDETADVVKQLRAYWQRYGGLGFDERMMAILTDPQASIEAQREAAVNLGELGVKRTISTTVFSSTVEQGPRQPNPAADKFANPTAAEAILAAMDRELKVDADPDETDFPGSGRDRIEDTYVAALVGLGDQRIAPELAARSHAATQLSSRRRYAAASHALGEPAPLAELVDEFAAGSIKLPPVLKHDTRSDDSATEELRALVTALSMAHTPQADRALAALAEPGHPQHALTVERILSDTESPSEGSFFLHPYCLTILRRALDDETPTGSHYSFKGDQVYVRGRDFQSWGGIPASLADPRQRKAEADERICDAVARKLSDLVVGLPEFHVLMPDADARRSLLKTAFDRRRGTYRLATRSEQAFWDEWQSLFVPDIAPLDHVATAQDVEAGRAVFHLEGRGRLADMKLPRAGKLRRDAQREYAPGVLIVQAEIDGNGKLIYGAIGRHSIEALPEAEVFDVTPFPPPAKDQEAEQPAEPLLAP